MTRLPKNAILTGLPRSGTTMMCSLLNQIPNVVALHEPMEPGLSVGLNNEEIVASIQVFFDKQRDLIRNEGRARSKSYKGSVPTNPLSDVLIDGKRERLIDGMNIAVSNVSSATFSLYLKHPGFFTVCLPFLSKHFPCYATVRNPLSVLLSWQKAGMAVSNGRLPAAEPFDPRLRDALAAEPDRIERQIIILEYFYRMYSTHIPDHTIRYEDVIATKGRSFAIIEPGAARFNETLESRNKLNIGDSEEVRNLLDRLVNRPQVYDRFYSRQDVMSLVA